MRKKMIQELASEVRNMAESLTTCGEVIDALLDILMHPTEEMLDTIAAYRSRRTHEQVMDDRLGWTGQHEAVIRAVKDGK